MNKNLGGLNPSFKEFLDKKPNITLMGFVWAGYWRFTIIVLIVELIVFGLIAIFAGGFTLINH